MDFGAILRFLQHPFAGQVQAARDAATFTQPGTGNFSGLTFVPQSVLGASTTAPVIPKGPPGPLPRIDQRPNPTPTPQPTASDNSVVLAGKGLEGYRQQARDLRNSGQQTFQSLLDSVNKFRDRAQTGFQNAGQQITDTASNILGSNARTAQELQGTSRAMGRAMGLGDSSKFNQQNKLLANLAGTQGSTIATKGQNERANQLALAENQATADTNEQAANRYLQDINTQAGQIEQGGQLNYENALNNIVQYQRQLAEMNHLNPDSVATTAPNFTGITNTLNTGVLPTGGVPATGIAPNAGLNPGISIGPSAVALATNPYLKRRPQRYA